MISLKPPTAILLAVGLALSPAMAHATDAPTTPTTTASPAEGTEVTATETAPVTEDATSSVTTMPRASTIAAPTIARVTAIVDGDTLRTSRGTIRLIGVDTPERGRCGYSSATANLRRLAPVGATVKLAAVTGRDNKDGYGRYLRYVSSRGVDLGGAQISAGWADARYDSWDGYEWHPREASYRANDDTTANRYRDAACAAPAKSKPSTSRPNSKGSSASRAGKYTGCRAYGRYGTSRDEQGRRYTKINCKTKRPLR